MYVLFHTSNKEGIKFEGLECLECLWNIPNIPRKTSINPLMSG